MDRLMFLHRELNKYIPKHKFLLFLVFTGLKAEVEREAKRLKKDEVIEVKWGSTPTAEEVRKLWKGDERKLYTALLKVLSRKYHTAERIWEEVKRWKEKHAILHFV